MNMQLQLFFLFTLFLSTSAQYCPFLNEHIKPGEFVKLYILRNNWSDKQDHTKIVSNSERKLKETLNDCDFYEARLLEFAYVQVKKNADLINFFLNFNNEDANVFWENDHVRNFDSIIGNHQLLEKAVRGSRFFVHEMYRVYVYGWNNYIQNQFITASNPKAAPLHFLPTTTVHRATQYYSKFIKSAL